MLLLWTAFAAVGVREGIEPLHAEQGLLTDEAMPEFNRFMRGRLYEALLAEELFDRDSRDPRLLEFIESLLDAGPEWVSREKLLRAAVIRGLQDYAEQAGIEDDRWMAHAPQVADAALNHSTRLIPARRGQTPEQTADALHRVISLIRPYWERPIVRPDVAWLEEMGPEGGSHAQDR